MTDLARWAIGIFGILCLSAAGLGWALGREPRSAPRPAPGPDTPVDESRTALPASQGGIQLQLPIACELGRDCQIQNYTDRDPGPGAEDYRCGTRTYQDHNGTDFRILDMAAQRRGVNVLAASDGVVSAIRDGVPDVSVRVRGMDQVAGQECGNGVVITHPDGVSTQYCHMAQGSIRVASGQAVTAGAILGQVGLSGQSEYPHLHFTVRRHGAVVDPFASDAAPDPAAEACAAPTASLWSRQAADQMGYAPRVVLNSGASSEVVTMETLEEGAVAPATTTGAALVFYVRALGLQSGDVQSLTVRGPDGEVVAQNRAEPLTSNRAQQMIYAGKRSSGRAWPAGTYRIEYQVTAGGQQVLEQISSAAVADSVG